MRNGKFRIAVVSDIHAAVPDDKGGAPSYASTAPSLEPTGRDAIVSLRSLIAEEQLHADLLVCCGDLADRANPTALNYIWTQITGLASALSAEPVSTVGNHDIDSRFKDSDFDARGILRGLKPSFPIPDVHKNHEFWSRNFSSLEYGEIQLIILNSCAYHGFNPDPAAPEFLHGRVSPSTLDDLRSHIETLPSSKTNLLICHHHPHRHQDIELEDYSSMVGGERLIDMLRDTPGGRWMIVHGHKHHPRLVQGAGGARAPLIFGAGSLSAKLHADLQGRASNQFYVIEFDHEAARELELDMAGKIYAWDFCLGEGWFPAKRGLGLPRVSGFGYTIPSIRKEARQIAEIVSSNGGIVPWAGLLQTQRRELAFALPNEINDLLRDLRSTHSVVATYSDDGTLFQLARSV